jgi:hypothetical protein
MRCKPESSETDVRSLVCCDETVLVYPQLKNRLEEEWGH